MADRPDNIALIIGAMKCGTSSLFSYLAQHPEIAGSKVKEPDFFASDDNFARGMGWYRDLWQWDGDVHRIALEASTNYTKMPGFPNAAARIATIAEARFRFIYIMRDPVKRIESHRIHRMDTHWREFERDPGGFSEHEINTSRYAMQLEPYFAHFPAERIFLTSLEELKEDPERVLRDIFRFLGVDPEFRPVTATALNTRSHRADAPLLRRARALPLVRRLGFLVPPALRGAIRSRLKGAYHDRLLISDEERGDVLEALRPDLLELKARYDIDPAEKWGISV